MTLSEVEDGPEPAATLRTLPLLRFLPEEVRRLVEDSFVPTEYPFGAVIVREGDPADAVYVLTAGTARVLRQGEHGEEVPLNLLQPGDSFGEQAFFADSRRTATVRASTAVQTLRLDGALFRALLGRHPEIGRALQLTVREQRLGDFLRVYSAFRDLPPAALTVLLAELEPVDVAAGEVVVSQGDPAGPMYVVEEGRLRVRRRADGSETDVGFLRKGDFFGERSLLAGSPRDASVEAVSDARLLRLPAATYARLLEVSPELRQAVEARVATYDYRTVARVPLDFAEEILPADVGGRDTTTTSPPHATPEPEPGGATPSAGAEDDILGTPTPGRRRRRFPQVWQVDEMDCGAACVAMVCRHFGRAVSLTAVRRALRTSTHGTSLLGIAEGAEELGLDCRTVKASKSRLDRLPLPAVVHWEGNHWVVAYDVSPTWVRVADPARGCGACPGRSSRPTGAASPPS